MTTPQFNQKRDDIKRTLLRALAPPDDRIMVTAILLDAALDEAIALGQEYYAEAELEPTEQDWHDFHVYVDDWKSEGGR